ncbi:pilus assembly protein [Achromobacter spanius]
MMQRDRYLRCPARQQGQAIVEALLMLPLMAVLVWAVSWVGGLQFSAQQLSQVSRKTAMFGALGQPVAPAHSTVAAGLRQRILELPGIAPSNMSVLQGEWFGDGLRLLSVYARAMPSRKGQAPIIARHAHVAIGAGHAHGDADARRRIGNAPTAWRQVERASLAQARRVGPATRRMDGPWRRAALQTDWLSAWADVVPPDRLGIRKGRKP